MSSRPAIDPEILSSVERFDREMEAPDLDLAQQRKLYSSIMAEQQPTGEPVEMRDLVIPTRHGDMAARLYMPNHETPPPLLVYMHGGGFVVGDLDTLNVPLTHVARESGCAILSLDYKLAPEFLYPVAYEQCEDALDWAIGNTKHLGVIDRFGIGGDSAGGNLTALLALRCGQAMGEKLVWQLLINPVLDFPGVELRENLSHQQFGSGPILSSEVMAGFNKAYFPDREAMLAASPLHADMPATLPPAYIAAAECDPLRDDSIHYAEKLLAHGVEARLKVFPGMCHNFTTLSHKSKTARQSLDDVAAEARRSLRA